MTVAWLGGICQCYMLTAHQTGTFRQEIGVQSCLQGYHGDWCLYEVVVIEETKQKKA